jgi:hypothetical protein
MARHDPNVWSGRASQEVFVELAVSGLASMYPAFNWSFRCSEPSWISARVRSHYRTGFNEPFGSPVFACAGKTDPPSLLILSQTSAGSGFELLQRAPQSPAGRSNRWGGDGRPHLKAPAASQNAPGDAGQLVCECDRQHVAM